MHIALRFLIGRGRLFRTMVIGVEVQKTQSESNLSALRRFSKRVQGSGILNRVRSNRYHARTQSLFKRKQSKLTHLKRAAEREKLARLGKLPTGKK